MSKRIFSTTASSRAGTSSITWAWIGIGATASKGIRTSRGPRSSALYDNPAFDPKAETLPIAAFEPMLRRVFAQPRNSIYAAAVLAAE